MISRNDVASYPLEDAVKDTVSAFSITPEEFYGPPGKQHYRLLSHLSMQFNNRTIIDIGTHKGSSALALSVNPTNTVYSFDIRHTSYMQDLSNCTFEIANLWDANCMKGWEETILDSAMIVLDIDPHHGSMEYEFYLWLKERDYKGLLFCDDIHYFKGMRDNFWLRIPGSEKLDITYLGHWSGTGVVAFNEQPFKWDTYSGVRTIGDAAPISNTWTVVTAYFDLTKMSDASAPIKARNANHYLQSARATLALEQPMIVFCEKETVAALKAFRPEHLLSVTEFRVVDFEDMPMTKYRDTIASNRVKYPYQGDERNTPSYYLFCMSRYAMLKQAMEDNPFKSTHFSWLNICIERMGYANLAHLDDVFRGEPRDKVSTCYIDYVPQTLVENVPEYFKFGRCSLCSGFFTGAKEYLYEFCCMVEEAFLSSMKLGYGHADEQLFSIVYFGKPELFDVYYGDYFDMIVNYRKIYQSPGMPLNNIAVKSFGVGDWNTCFNACTAMWNAPAGTYVKNDVGRILQMYVSCANKLGTDAINTIKANGAMDAFYATKA
jgi:hypothetical protein